MAAQNQRHVHVVSRLDMAGFECFATVRLMLPESSASPARTRKVRLCTPRLRLHHYFRGFDWLGRVDGAEYLDDFVSSGMLAARMYRIADSPNHSSPRSAGLGGTLCILFIDAAASSPK